MLYKMFKYVNYTIMFGSYVLIGLLCGIFAAKIEGLSSVAGMLIIILLIADMYIMTLIHTILHEGGHFIAGLLTGYELISFRIGTLTFVKGTDGKIHTKKSKLVGTGGQCLMSPPKVPLEKCPYKWYHLSGGLVNIVTGIIALLLFLFVFPMNALTFALLGQFAIIGLSTGISNLLPSKMGGIQNDGYNLIDISNNPLAIEYINLVLEAHAVLTTAESIEDIPDSFMKRIMSIDFTNLDLTNVAIANAFNIQISFYFINRNHEKVNELVKVIIDTPGVLELFKNEAKCERLFYEIVYGDDNCNIDKLYDNKLQKYVKATAMHPSRQLLFYAYYNLYKKDDKLAEKAYNKLKRCVDTHSIKLEALINLEIADEIRTQRRISN